MNCGEEISWFSICVRVRFVRAEKINKRYRERNKQMIGAKKKQMKLIDLQIKIFRAFNVGNLI
jgi:hypothetical protein